MKEAILIGREKSRNRAIDVLRILAMILVTSHHYLGHGGVLDSVQPFSANWFLAWFLRCLAYTSVVLFYLISAYYLYDHSGGIKWVIFKICKLWVQVEFYSICSLLVMGLCFNQNISVVDILKSVFPVLERSYGFFNGYVFLTILSPILTQIFKNLEKRLHILLIFFLCLMCSVFPYISFIDVFHTDYGEGCIWLIFLFTITAYIRKYAEINKHSAQQYYLIALICVLLTFLSKILISVVSNRLWGTIKYSTAFYGETPFLMLIASVCMLSGALTTMPNRQKKNVVIDFLAKNSFAVYLMQENNLVRKSLWEFLNVSSYANSTFGVFVLNYIVVIGAIYLVSVTIEWLRNLMMKKIKLDDFLYRVILNIGYKIYHLYERLLYKLWGSK